MTTSLRKAAKCAGITDDFSVRDVTHLAERLPPFHGLQLPEDGTISTLALMRHLERHLCEAGSDYHKVPVPPELRSPSMEEGQILIDGIAREIALFMGRSDWELDWHIFPTLDQDVHDRLLQSGELSHDTLFCEFMVIDDSHDETLGRTWYSSDMDAVLMLATPPADNPDEWVTASEYWSARADDSQGSNVEVAALDSATRANSHLLAGRVYLQGVFVNDEDHLEIHPLDSIAYAREFADSQTLLQARAGDGAWPDSTLTWRVAAVTNAGGHRINNCDFLARARTTTWYLDLPGRARAADAVVTVVEDPTPRFRYPATQHHHLFPPQLPETRWISERGVSRVTVQPPPDGRPRPTREYPRDPLDPQQWPKLKVTVTMDQPSDCEGPPWQCGGFWLRDYTVGVG